MSVKNDGVRNFTDQQINWEKYIRIHFIETLENGQKFIATGYRLIEKRQLHCSLRVLGICTCPRPVPQPLLGCHS